MVDITQDKIRIRTMVPGDAAALLKWMTDARVLEFYEGRDKRYTEELIREDFFEENNDSVMKVIVEYDGVPIGYGQIYPMGGEDYGHYGYDNRNETVYCLDQFIGEPDYWNKGIGTVSKRARNVTWQQLKIPHPI